MRFVTYIPVRARAASQRNPAVTTTHKPKKRGSEIGSLPNGRAFSAYVLRVFRHLNFSSYGSAECKIGKKYSALTCQFSEGLPDAA
jgi:hypothetical protein